MALEGVSVRVATVSNKGFYDRGLSDLLESGLGGLLHSINTGFLRNNIADLSCFYITYSGFKLSGFMSFFADFGVVVVDVLP